MIDEMRGFSLHHPLPPNHSLTTLRVYSQKETVQKQEPCMEAGSYSLSGTVVRRMVQGWQERATHDGPRDG